MLKRIVFHVGAPKAGSTYLQKRLKSNTEALMQNGIFYPILSRYDKVAANAKIVTLGIDPRGASQFVQSFPELNLAKLDPQAMLDELLERCPDQTETIILSSEKTRPHHAEHLATLFQKRTTCDIILIVRKQDDWLDSYYNQQVKNKNTTQDISQFLHTLMKPGQLDFAVPDWLMHYKKWKQCFHKVDVVFFDTSKQDLFDRFGRSIGLEDTSRFHEIERQNESLSAFELIYILDLSANITHSVFAQYKRVLSKVSQAHLVKRERFSFLSRRDRKILIDRFERGNNQLLQIFDTKAGILNIDQEAPNYIDVNDARSSQDYKDFRDHVDTILRDKANAATLARQEQ